MIVVGIIVIDGFEQSVIEPVDRSAIAGKDICDVMLVTKQLKSLSLIHVQFPGASRLSYEFVLLDRWHV
jgi:hypothetical protein